MLNGFCRGLPPLSSTKYQVPRPTSAYLGLPYSGVCGSAAYAASHPENNSVLDPSERSLDGGAGTHCQAQA